VTSGQRECGVRKQPAVRGDDNGPCQYVGGRIGPVGVDAAGCWTVRGTARRGWTMRRLGRVVTRSGHTPQAARPARRHCPCDMLYVLALACAAGGSMSFREQLHAYIAQLEQRLRWSTLLRGLAILTGSALLATLVLVTIANALAFSHGSVTAARFGLILGSGRCRCCRVGAAPAPPDPPPRGGDRRSRLPAIPAALTTFTERDGQDPFIETFGRGCPRSRPIRRARANGHRPRLWSSLGAVSAPPPS